MTVRKIRSEELKQAHEIAAQAFEFPSKYGDLDAQAYFEKVTGTPMSRQDVYWDGQWAAFDEFGQMSSIMTVIPYQAGFDGHAVPMAGIGGVATVPEARSSGGIRVLFENILPDMYRGGTLFSYLFPFSTKFYRKFGYELGCEWIRWKIKLAGVEPYEPKGRFTLISQGNVPAADLILVEKEWRMAYNCMVHEEEIEYIWAKQASPYTDRKYAYLYRDEKGRPRGYMIYRPGKDKSDRTLYCDRMIFADEDAFFSLLSLLRGMRADHDAVVLTLPVDIRLDRIIREWSFDTAQRSVESHGMLRAVNAGQLLRLAHAKREGTIVIGLTDEQIPENCGSYEVVLHPGEENQAARTDREPDVQMDIQTFSQFIFGIRVPGEETGLFTVRNERVRPALDGLFYRKKSFICTPF